MAELDLKVRFAVMKRDHFTCVYCGRRPPAVELNVDHAKSKNHGGSSEMDNLVTACFECNNGKRGESADHTIEKPAPVGSVFLGKFLHRFDGQRKISRQGHIESVDEATAMIRWFSFMDGRPMDLGAVPISELSSGLYTFYDSEDDWNDAYTRQVAREFGRNPEEEIEYQRRVRDLFRETSRKQGE